MSIDECLHKICAEREKVIFRETQIPYNMNAIRRYEETGCYDDKCNYEKCKYYIPKYTIYQELSR